MMRSKIPLLVAAAVATVAWSARPAPPSAATTPPAPTTPSAPATPSAPTAPAPPPATAAPDPAPRPLVTPRPDLAGAWRTDRPEVPPYVQMTFSRVEGADPAAAAPAWKVWLTLPEGGLFERELLDAEVEDGRRFRGTVKIGPATARIEGALAEDGRAITGSVEVRQGEQSQTEPLALVPTVPAPTVPGATTYGTVLDAMGVKLPMSLTLADAGELGWVGTTDIPAQMITAMPTVVTRADDGVFTVTLPVGVRAVMTLKAVGDDGSLSGSFEQGPVNVPIAFVRSTAPLAGTARPQVPVPPFPYTEREVAVPCGGDQVLAGTLTLPDGASATAQVPAVVMLTGSGLQDRDESLMGHRPFLVIADALARAGIAVLRCDDRGHGRSTGDPTHATLQDFAGDGRAMMRFLREQPEVDPSRCGYVGHSEGGITGPLAALADQKESIPVAFVVMLAGPGVSGAELLPVQVERLQRAAGVAEESIAPLLEANRRIFAAIRAGEGTERLSPLIAEGLAIQQRLVAERAGIEPPPAPAPDSAEVQAVVAQLGSAWMRSFLEYEPAPTLEALEAPVLALNGDLDTQVDADQNLVRVNSIRKEAGRPITARRYPGLNHLFQPAKTGGIDEYALIETTVDPQVLDDLVRWIRETAARSGAAERPR